MRIDFLTVKGPEFVFHSLEFVTDARVVCQA